MAHLLEDYAEDEAAGAGGARASTPRWRSSRPASRHGAREAVVDAGNIGVRAPLLDKLVTGTSAAAAVTCTSGREPTPTPCGLN